VPGLNVFELRARSLRPEPRVAAAASTSGNSSISSTWVAWIIGPFCQSIHPRTGIFDSLLRLVDHRPGMVAMRGDGCRRRLGVDEPDDRAVGEGKRLAILDLLCAFCGSESSQAKADVEGRAKERQVAARRDPRVTCRRCNNRKPPQLDCVPILFCSLLESRWIRREQVFAQGKHVDRGVPRMLARAAHRGYAYTSVSGNRRRATGDPVAQ
jgi:hypothetical protein